MDFEEEFKKLLESKGWTLFRSGWPDYAAVGPQGDRVFFELKDVGDRVSKHQKEMHDFLESNGTAVYIVGSNELRQSLYRMYHGQNRYAPFAQFKIIRVLQEGSLINEHIAKKTRLSPQLVDYHMKVLSKLGIVTRNEENGSYRLTDDYSTSQQSNTIAKLKPFIDDIRLRSKNNEEAVQKAINYFLVFLSNLFL